MKSGVPLLRDIPFVGPLLFSRSLKTSDKITLLIFLTGGLQNPFAFLFLGPVLLSATALPPRFTVMLGAFAVAGLSLIVHQWWTWGLVAAIFGAGKDSDAQRYNSIIGALRAELEKV